MKAEAQCIPCFLDQAVEALELAGADYETQIRTMKHLLSYLNEVDMNTSPPVLSRTIHAIIREQTGCPDPYLAIKEKSTETVIGLLPHLRELMMSSKDPISLAVKLGALGNVIDFGTPIRMDINGMVDRIVEKELTVFEIDTFKEELDKAETILFLGDNAGEIILDTFLLRELKDRKKTIIYGVREGPIINDATIEDARQANIQDFAELITTGSHGPGTLLGDATQELINALNSTDLIISKGQGNFESLSSDPRLKAMTKPGTPIFFLLTVKCGIVGRYAGVEEGSTIFSVHYPHTV